MGSGWVVDQRVVLGEGLLVQPDGKRVPPMEGARAQPGERKWLFRVAGPVASGLDVLEAPEKILVALGYFASVRGVGECRAKVDSSLKSRDGPVWISLAHQGAPQVVVDSSLVWAAF